MFEIMEKEKCQQSRGSSLSILACRSHSASYMFNETFSAMDFFFFSSDIHFSIHPDSQMYLVLDGKHSNFSHRSAARDIQSFEIFIINEYTPKGFLRPNSGYSCTVSTCRIQ